LPKPMSINAVIVVTTGAAAIAVIFAFAADLAGAFGAAALVGLATGLIAIFFAGFAAAETALTVFPASLIGSLFVAGAGDLLDLVFFFMSFVLDSGGCC